MQIATESENTREMVVDAAFAIAREQGAENINARTVSQRLGCSTQPVMYHFSTIEELKRAVYEKTDWYHTEYLMNIQKPQDGVMLGIGMNYIRFAIKEPNLFRFLFQSGFAVENNLLEMVDSEELKPVLNAMQAAMDMSMEETKKVFVTIALFLPTATPVSSPTTRWSLKKAWWHVIWNGLFGGAVLAIEEERK